MNHKKNKIMKIVTTKEELKKALDEKEEKIIVRGDYAKKIEKKLKWKKNGKIAGLTLAIGGVLLIPFTGGASIPIAMHGFSATLGGTVITASAGELAIILGIGGAVAMTALLKSYSFKYNKETGELTLERK